MALKLQKKLLLLFLIYFLSTVSFYAPYVLKKRFNVIERNWDGPAYIVIAKTFYNPKLIQKENYIRKYLTNPLMFANKMPLYPIFVRAFSFLSYEKSMLFVSFIFGFFSLVVFYFLCLELKIKKAFLLTFLFTFLPPRWFLMTKVGGVESMFMSFALLSLLLYFKQKYFVSALLLAFATLTKVNALLILVSYFCIFLLRKRKNFGNFIPYLLSPLMIFAVFIFYKSAYGDFFAYFRSDSRCYEYLSLFKMPYSVFDASACYVGSIHLEEMFWFYGLAFTAIVYMWKKKQKELLLFFLPSFAPMLFLQHNDFTRYGIFLYFLFGLIFEKYLTKKEAIIILTLLLPAIYLFARNFANINIFIP